MGDCVMTEGCVLNPMNLGCEADEIRDEHPAGHRDPQDPFQSLHTLELTTDNFARILSHNRATLIMFYASWDGPSKRFAPIFDDAAGRARKMFGRKVLGRVDVD